MVVVVVHVHKKKQLLGALQHELLPEKKVQKLSSQRTMLYSLRVKRTVQYLGVLRC